MRHLVSTPLRVLLPAVALLVARFGWDLAVDGTRIAACYWGGMRLFEPGDEGWDEVLRRSGSSGYHGASVDLEGDLLLVGDTGGGYVPGSA